MREDGSLRDADIALFLSSRYGIKISADEVGEMVLQNGLATTRRIEGQDYLDLDVMEIVSILFIPVLLKAVAASDSSKDTTISEKLQLPPPELLGEVLRMMLEDATG